jgi:hypothetical protein
MARRASQRTHHTVGRCLAVCAVLVAALLRPSDGLASHAGIKRAALSFPELHPALPIPRGAAGDASVRQAARALPSLKPVLALRGGDAAVATAMSSRSESPGSLKQKQPLAPAAPAAAPAAAPQQTQTPPKAAPAGGATLADLFSALSGPGPSSSVGNGAAGNGAAAQARTPPPPTLLLLQMAPATGLLREHLVLATRRFSWTLLCHARPPPCTCLI